MLGMSSHYLWSLANFYSLKVNERIESGELNLRDAYAEQMDSIDLPLEECQRILKESKSI
jgi:2-hydroxy-3-keto-5-methylthiopentenyl-1-phosphate phosphatase